MLLHGEFGPWALTRRCTYGLKIINGEAVAAANEPGFRNETQIPQLFMLPSSFRSSLGATVLEAGEKSYRVRTRQI
jgi:hypothetical protein